jgi:hypothetical protein
MADHTEPHPTPQRPRNIATFVLDAALPRESFDKLAQQDGVIPKLVQRLMEKHGAGDTVSTRSGSC